MDYKQKLGKNTGTFP